MDIRQVTETIAMIEESKTSIRTTLMGISLLKTVSIQISIVLRRKSIKITTKAANLVAVGDEIAAESWDFLKIISVSVTPIFL